MAALSGIITITTAGTAQQGPTTTPTTPGQIIWLKAHPDNTDTVWVGNDGAGDVAAANGFALNPGESVPVQTSNLAGYYFDSSVNGEMICWLIG